MSRLRTLKPRAQAALIVAAVLGRGRSLSAELDAYQGLERPLVQNLTFGVMRTLGGLQSVLDGLLQKPLKAKDLDIRCLLLLGLYQLFGMRVPDHAAIGETAEAARDLGKTWAVGLVNGLLRNAQRGREKWQQQFEQAQASRSHPEWLVRRLQTAWPESYRDIIAANDAHPFWIRINRRRTSREAYAQTLEPADIVAREGQHAPDALRLEQPLAVDRLPGFSDGLVSVQDAAAQLAATLLAPGKSERILDACAAPGGKTGHLLEICSDCKLLALDSAADRLVRIKQNLTRLGLTAQIRQGDASRPQDWWDRQPFDHILLDAPCSATGVIRRHPDIRWLRKNQDIDALTNTQAAILRALWPLLRPGDVYSTPPVPYCRRKTTCSLPSSLTRPATR